MAGIQRIYTLEVITDGGPDAARHVEKLVERANTVGEVAAAECVSFPDGRDADFGRPFQEVLAENSVNLHDPDLQNRLDAPLRMMFGKTKIVRQTGSRISRRLAMYGVLSVRDAIGTGASEWASEYVGHFSERSAQLTRFALRSFVPEIPLVARMSPADATYFYEDISQVPAGAVRVAVHTGSAWSDHMKTQKSIGHLLQYGLYDTEVPSELHSQYMASLKKYAADFSEAQHEH